MLLSHIKSPAPIYFALLPLHPLPSHLNYITLTSKNHQQIVNIHPYSHPNPHQKYLKTNTFRANFQQHTKPFNPIFEPSPTHSIRFQSKNPSRNPLKTPKPVDFDGL